eukprot:1156808-Pelagomonas_calceolata.AAC.2
MDVGSAGRLAQHDLHIPEQVSNRVIPTQLFNPSTSDQARHTSSRPIAILVCHVKSCWSGSCVCPRHSLRAAAKPAPFSKTKSSLAAT